MRLAAFGECMLEMRAQPDGAYRLAYGGDVFNTAVYARQLGLDVSFVSAVGDDHFSGWLLDAWAGHDLNLDGVQRVPLSGSLRGSRATGAITDGTRRRGQNSAARRCRMLFLS